MRKILHKVRGWISGRAAPAGTGAGTSRAAFIYVIKSGKQESPEHGADEQIAMLRRFSSFSDKEGMPVTAVFPGRPTRKVPDGARQGDVSVRYAAADAVTRVVDQAAKEVAGTHRVVVVTDAPDLVKHANSTGCTVLCTSTFEKALEAVSGPLRKENREPREPRGNRDARKPAQGAAQPKPAPESPAPKDDDASTEAKKPEVSVQPAPTPTTAAARKTQYEPSVEKRDKAILDLIDPL